MAGAVAVAGTAAFCGITAASVTTVGASAAFRIAVITAAGPGREVTWIPAS